MFLKFNKKLFFLIGDWGLGIGDWGLGIGPNPQSPIPKPQTPIPKYFCKKIILNKEKKRGIEDGGLGMGD